MQKIVSNVKQPSSNESSEREPHIVTRAGAIAESPAARSRTPRLRDVIRNRELRRDQFQLQSMVFPALVILFVFSYLPMWGVLIAFQDFSIFDGFWQSEWVGFKHFAAFFTARDFGQIMRNTLVISFLKLFLGFPAPIILALILTEMRRQSLKRIAQTITYLPHFLSWVIVSGFVLTLLSVRDGSVNLLLTGIGVIDEPVAWLSQPRYFWGILVTANIWKDVGFGSIIYLAAIAGINPELYEAASVDGAGRLQKIFIITLPSIAPQIIVLLILRISNILNAGFQDILLLTNNGQNAILREVSDVIDTYVFRVGLTNRRFSYATAAGLSKSIVNIAMLWGANALSRRISETSLW